MVKRLGGYLAIPRRRRRRRFEEPINGHSVLIYERLLVGFLRRSPVGRVIRLELKLIFYSGGIVVWGACFRDGEKRHSNRSCASVVVMTARECPPAQKIRSVPDSNAYHG